MHPLRYFSSSARQRLGEWLRRRPEPREASRIAWGKDVKRERFSFQISRYHDLLAGTREAVDDTTWQDLGMEEVFAKVDRTASFPGRQVLYHQMKTYEVDEDLLAERARQHAIFRSDQPLREAIHTRLTPLDTPDAAWLGPLLMNGFPERPRWTWLLRARSCASG